MKKKPGKYLNFYYKYIESGKLPGSGLCQSFSFCDMDFCPIDIFKPVDDFEYSPWFLGDGKVKGYSKRGEFTPLRQSVVLLLAAMHNEL